MGLRNPFRRNRAQTDNEAPLAAHNPWWAWGPLGLIWYGEHHNTTNIDAGNTHQTGDAGNFHQPFDPGAGFGGFDGGAGGAGGV